MSSRAFRRLQTDSNVIKLPTTSSGLVETDEDEKNNDLLTWTPQAQTKKKAVVNPFDVFTGDQEESLEEDEVDNEDIVPVPVSEQSHAKKKRKKKKKKKARISEFQDQEDDVETAIKEVTELLGGLETTGQKEVESTGVKTPSLRPLLTVDRRFLNADNEMRKIFGSRVVRAERSQRRAHSKRFQKKSILATPKDTWPQMERLGLSMQLSEVKNNCQYFVFEHSTEYQKIQCNFWDAVETYDPNSIARVLHAHPYHIDSLLQLSEVCKMGEDLQMASDLIERALYHFECSFHPLFNFTQDNCRLSYSRTENRSLFLVLFRHLNYIGRRGCHRTAFEFCRLLLSLEPDSDPLCVLLCIDYYAIRACEYQFMIDLGQRWEVKKNLSQLPNCAFSIALALFHQSSLKDEEEQDMLASANKRLQDALIMFPSLLVSMLDKCGVALDKSAGNHTYFTSPQKDPEALQLLIKLYVERSHSLWKEPEVLSWLETNVIQVIKRVNDSDPLIMECYRKRQRCYIGTPRNIYRHVILSDMEAITTTLPQDITGTPIMMYDPLPPEDSTSGYTRPPRSQRHIEDDSNPFTLFLRSLLPSFNLQGQGQVGLPRPGHIPRPVGIPQAGPQEGEEGAIGGMERADGFALEQAIGQLTNSLRNLLDQIRTVVDANVSSGEENQEEERDER